MIPLLLNRWVQLLAGTALACVLGFGLGHHQKTLEDASALDHRLPWWRGMNLARQRVLCEMAFNVGVGRLLGFHRMLADLEAGKYSAGADEMLASVWARQVGERAQRLAAAMRAG